MRPTDRLGPLLLAFLWTSPGAIGIATAPPPDPDRIPVRIIAGTYVVAPVWISGRGPHLMLVDTGTTVTQLGPGLAASLNLEPSDRLVLSGPTGERTAGRVHVSLRVASAEVDGLEAVIMDLGVAGRLSSIEGILGQNFLAQFDYTIDYRNRQLWLGSSGWRPPREGQAPLPLIFADGRPMVTARIGDAPGRTVRLVLDSGASDVVLFGDRAALARTPGVVFSGTADLLTLAGKDRVETGWLARLSIGHASVADVRFAAVPGPATIDGLLPTRLLGAISVSAARGQVSIF